MRKFRLGVMLLFGGASAALVVAQAQKPLVFADYRTDKPGNAYKITVGDLPKAFATESVNNNPKLAARPDGAMPQAPAGYSVSHYASSLENPRLIRTAPNGDLFVAESRPGRVKVLRGAVGADKAETTDIFASGLNRPFGIAFYPLGAEPAVGLRRQHRLDRPLPLQERRSQGERAAGNDRRRAAARRAAARRRPLDARHRVLARRQEDVRRRRIVHQRRRSRTNASRKGPRHDPRVQPRRHRPARLRVRHPQRRRPRRPSADRRALGIGQRARRSRRQPRARLHHARRATAGSTAGRGSTWAGNQDPRHEGKHPS